MTRFFSSLFLIKFSRQIFLPTILLSLISKPVFAGGLLLYNVQKIIQHQEAQKKINACIAEHGHLCSLTLNGLVDDDKKNGFFNLLPSRAPICLQRLSSEKTKSEWQKYKEQLKQVNINLNGEANVDFLASCSNGSIHGEQELFSKYYYYTARFNSGLRDILQNQNEVDSILGQNNFSCEGLESQKSTLAYCQQLKSCPSSLKLEQLTNEFLKEKPLYDETLKKFQKIPQNCPDENCRKEKETLFGIINILQEKYPWLLEDSFSSTHSLTETQSQIKQYLKNLATKGKELRNKIVDAMSCLNTTRDCDLKQIRQLLSKMPELSNSAELPTALQSHLSDLMYTQSCLENGALERNSTEHTLNSVTTDGILTLGSFGLGCLPMLAKFGYSTRALNSIKLGGESTLFLMNLYNSSESWKETSKKCGTDGDTYKFNTLNKSKNICKESNHFLSSVQRDAYNCRISVLLSIVDTLPAGAQFARWKTEFNSLDADMVKNQAGENFFSRINNYSRNLIETGPVRQSAETKNIRNFTLRRAPNIKFETIKEPSEIPSGIGYGFRRIMSGKINGENVFIKESTIKDGEKVGTTRTLKGFVNEVGWTKRLDELGIGVKFKGITKTDDGYLAIVTENFPGIHFNKNSEQLPQVFKPTQSLITDLKKIKSILYREGIDGYDLQILISENHAKVIDPEFFRAADKISDIEFNTEQIDELIDHLSGLMTK